MSLTDRDRKIVLVLAPLVLLLGYWFGVLAPQRAESAKVEEQLTKARGERDTAQAQIGQLNAAKASFAGDYQTVIRMGKAIPDNTDMPSLLVQLDRAARGTGIEMAQIQVTPAATTPGATGSTPPGGGGNPGAGGTGAQSAQGKAVQGAGNAVNDANAKNQQNADAAGGAGAPPAAGQQAPGLSTVGLQFELSGDFFSMAEFFHRMKRFVRVANENLVIRGRLIVIDNWSFEAEPNSSGLKATVGASVYLSPKAQGGVTVGATPGGPGAAPGPTPGGGAGNVAADPATQSPSPSNPPTASASP